MIPQLRLSSVRSSYRPRPYGQRTGGVWALWVVARRSGLHTDFHDSGTTVTTFVTLAAQPRPEIIPGEFMEAVTAMKRLFVFILGLSVLAVGCGAASPTQPSQGTQTTSTFTVPLSAANEVPTITNADQTGAGTATIALTVTKDDSGTITSATADIQIAVTGLPPGTVVTDAHIHNAAAGVNGGVFVPTGLTSGELTLVDGSGSVTKNGINVPADRAAAILNNPAGHYFNVHTALNPNGAMRGQLAGGGATLDPGVPVSY